MTDSQRLISKIDQSGNCWEWTGAKTRQGYGRIKWGGIFVAAHRASYEYFVGSIPEGRVLDHLCRNRPCVRPEHLEPVTLLENLRRGLSAIVEEQGGENQQVPLGAKLVVHARHLDRFWSKIERKNRSQCWLWTKGVNGNGYGTFTIGSRSTQKTWDVHRFAFLISVGTPPEGFVLDHLCATKLCVNPSHLQPVTRETNSLRWHASVAK
jgi:hypothetical protein